VPTFKKLATRGKLQVSNAAMRFFPVTPECFYRGSSPSSPGFPIKACGYDEQ
jgi:hypothetical protein